MQELSPILIEHQRHGAWTWVTLGSSVLVAAHPGQFLALRCAVPGSYDPLIRQPLFITATDSAADTCSLLVEQSDPAFPFLTDQPRSAALDILGPLGKGWQIDAATRTIALIGVAEQAAPLFALAHYAVAGGLAVSLILGATDHEAAPPPLLLPAAAEYNIALSKVPAAAALKLLDDTVLRWADMLAIALPHEYWSAVAQRVNAVRIRWGREFTQVAVLPPLACCVGVCGACGVETRHGQRLACVHGPIFDLRELAR